MQLTRNISAVEYDATRSRAYRFRRQVGWPTSGHVYATVANAQEFNGGVIRHCLSGTGTPLKPRQILGCYVFEVLDEDKKSTSAGDFEPHWGVFDATVSASMGFVLHVSFSQSF